MIGKTLAHYEITARIGEGGMGEVYRARDTKLGREVALKLLPPGFDEDADRLRRFEREARLLASLSHPYIATIHDFERDEGHWFLVLELVEGEDLARRLSRGRLPTREAISIAARIAEGIEVAHAKGIIHRDLKPANIKQTPDGGVKILDFGLARVSETGPRPADLENSPTMTLDRTQEGVILGTAPYMSPGQLKGSPADAQTDIWAFGCVLYEMLTGTSPFRAQTFPEIVAKILDHDPDWERLPADLPPSVARLVRRCLAKDSRHRLHAAADIRIVLEEALETTPESVTVGSASRRTSALRVSVLAIAAFALGAVTVLQIWQPGSETEGTRLPVRLMIPVRDEPAVIPMPESSSVAVSPDGRIVVYVASSTAEEDPPGETALATTELVRRSMDDFEATPIEGTQGGSSPFFSPDGEWIGFFDFHTGVLSKVARGGGARLDICSVSEVSFRGAHWGENGRIYFADSSGISMVDADGGVPRTIAEPDRGAGEKTYRFPHLLPGSKALLFTLGTSEILSYDDASIAVLDLPSGDIRVLARGGANPRYVPTGHVVFGRAGKVLALPFDLDAVEVTGSPVEILEGVVTSDGYGSAQFSFSDDGTLVYVAGGPDQFSTRLSILHRDGRVDDLSQPARPHGSVRVSPDGNLLAVSVLGANASLWIYELRRGTMTRLVSGWDNYSPLWNATGDTIAFGSNRDGRSGIWITSSDGAGSTTLLTERASPMYPESWSPDGEWVAFSSLSPSTGMDIWLVDRDGDASSAIQSAARELGGRFSPDGRHIAYTSDESGRLEVYVQTYPITGQKWKLSEDGGDAPVWSREGDEIYYWSGQRLMVVPVEQEPSFRPSRARQLLVAPIEVHSYDVFPDGERFVILGRVSTRDKAASGIARGYVQQRLFPAQSPDLRVVLDWFVDFDRRAAQP